jgi:hypothetical protein
MGWAPRDCIAVLGAARTYNEAQLTASFRIGQEIGRRGKCLLTGATTGIPYAAALGAHLEGALVVGISPAGSIEDHLSKYRKPVCQADVLLFTGMGPDGRSPLILRSAKGAVFVGGELGTLSEFCSGWMCGNNILGILRDAGGVADSIPEILSKTSTSWGSQVIYEADATTLASMVCDAVDRTCSIRSSYPRFADPCEDVRNLVARLLEQEAAAR